MRELSANQSELMTLDGPASARPDITLAGSDRLSWLEKAQIRFVRRTFEPGRVDDWVRACQRHVGSTWIHYCTRHLRSVHGLERLPELRPEQSFILVSNHRSFFDLYVVMGDLVRRGLPHRIVFPVRSKFFYTSPAGLLVNGVMSFFAMYPPIFRERRQAALNPKSLDELIWLLRRGGVFAGLHPEGMRKQDDDPYTLLPAQRGVGRIIQGARVPVIPVFINGLRKDNLPRQITGNFDRTGEPILVVFGEPIEFGGLLDKPNSPKAHQAIADRTLEVITGLGQEEKQLRALLDPLPRPA